MLILLIAIVSLILQFFLPWWIIAPVAFALSLWKSRTALQAFGSGFTAIFLLWSIMALFHSIPNNNILANRIGQLFMLPDMPFNWIFMVIIAGILGGIVAGFAALSGFYCRFLLEKPKESHSA